MLPTEHVALESAKKEETDTGSSQSLYNANFLFVLGISGAMVFSMVATPDYN